MAAEGFEFSRRPAAAPMAGRLSVMAVVLAVVGSILVVKESFFFQKWRTAPSDTVVQVDGEVPHPGWYELESATVHDALRAAGASTAGIENHPVESGRRIQLTDGRVQVAPSGMELVVGMPLNLNTAEMDALLVLPGIGATRAEAIMQRRQEAPFRRVEELLEVHGIGPKTLEKLRPFVHVGP